MGRPAADTPPRVHVLAMAILVQAATNTGLHAVVKPWPVRLRPIPVDANGEGMALSGPRQGAELWAGSDEGGLDALYHMPAGADLRPLDLDATHAPMHVLSSPNASHAATARCVGRTPSAAKCQAQCSRLTGCTAFVWRPSREMQRHGTQRGDDAQQRLCPRCASRAWELQCCLRFDDVWEPVAGRESAGPGTVSGLAFSFATTLPWFGETATASGDGAAGAPGPAPAPAPASTAAIPADTHGSLWALGRAVCQSHSMDLCPSAVLRRHAAPRDTGYSLAAPVLDSCREWAQLASSTSSSSPSSSQPYWWGASEASGMRGVHLACCRPAGVKSLLVAETVDAACFDAAAIEDALAAGEELAAEAITKPKPGCKTVLRIGLNHGGAGFFAQVLFALNQLRYAQDRGLVPYVDFGPCTLPGHVTGSVNRFFDGNVMAAGNTGRSWANAWEYFFEPVSAYRPGDLGVAVRALESDQMWALHGSSRKSVYAYYYGRFEDKRLGGKAANAGTFDAKWYRKMRRRAAALIARYLRPRKHITQKVDEFWRNSGCASAPFVVGVHMRGTDKAPDIGGAIVPPAAYYRFIDEQLVIGGPHALLFLATDSPHFVEEVRRKYGARLRHTTALRSEKNAFLSDFGVHGGGETDSDDGGRGPARKGTDVLVDALLLSRCDYLIKSSSAVGEFAVYFSDKLRLDEHSKDIQFLPPAAGADDDASPLLKQ